MVTTDGSLNSQLFIALATNIASQFALWQSALPSTWKPASVPTYSPAPSIQVASTYEHVAPTVYANISIANSVNRQRTTELECLSLIGSCLADIPYQEDRQQTGLPSTLMARAQILVDEICASLPFRTSDVTAGELWCHDVLVPMVREPSYGSGRKCTVPENTTKHAQQVVTSGLYMMYGKLTLGRKDEQKQKSDEELASSRATNNQIQITSGLERDKDSLRNRLISVLQNMSPTSRC
ncbi:hypothetical protein DER46DRAFT_681915 [Fusarium sp. MPI-SDFR-AT-0072]|nr:hypothetical protein DER46DRAFT_681915 [Fusarium sp. MPI-SDFR-AT-0072]